MQYEIIYVYHQQYGYFHFPAHSQVSTNPGHQSPRQPKLSMVAPNIFCIINTIYLLYITPLVSRIWKWLLDFWKICIPLHTVIS